MNQKIKKILDEIEKGYSKYIVDRVKHDQKKYNFDMPNDSTHNNEADAYKHTWIQTELALKGNPWLAKVLGDMHEKDGNIRNSQPKNEEIMDQHNNATLKDGTKNVNTLTFGGVDNGFLNKIKGKKFQDLSDEERLKAIWHYI